MVFGITSPYPIHLTFVFDHVQVSATFDVQVKVVDEEKRKKIYEDLMKRMDKLENEFLPQVELDSLELDFSVVKFPNFRTIWINLVHIMIKSRSKMKWI